MMLLSRFWYVILAVFAALGVYVAFLAVGQYNRKNALSMKEGLASDSQTVEWALKIDARRRLDHLLPVALEQGLTTALVAASGQRERVPVKTREDAKKALTAAIDKVVAEYRPEALFAVDREGRVIAEVGYAAVSQNEEFELGGYPAVNDALHGWIRDDLWLWGNKLYAVGVRPVEHEAGQAPVGAVVGLKEVSRKFVEDVAKRTRTNLAFFAAGARVAIASGAEGFEESQLEQVSAELKVVGEDPGFSRGRSDVRQLSDTTGAIFTRLPGDAWDQQAGFAVVRARASVPGPMGFVSGADDKDKQSVPWVLLIALVLISVVVGLVFTVFEHTLPIRELSSQAEKLREGKQDGLTVSRFRGAYREAAQNINAGMDRVVEKAGGVAKRPADLESILGPTPLKPQMSAFAFPNEKEAPVPSSRQSSGGFAPPPSSTTGSNPGHAPPPSSSAVVSFPSAVEPAKPGPPKPAKPPPPAAAPKPPPPKPAAPASANGGASADPEHEDDDEATRVAPVPASVMAAAGGESEMQEWLQVFEDFVSTKKQCGELTEGLTFEKFQNTLRKNRDALVERHGCKKVKFTVYIKDGRASLKASPVRE